MWFLSDPIVRSENESEENFDAEPEVEGFGDDALVKSFFISEWFFKN